MPKTFRGLYNQIYSFEHLLAAYRRARRGKRARPDVAAFEFRCEDELRLLSVQPHVNVGAGVYNRATRESEVPMTTLSEKVSALPPDLRREVEDFIEFLLEKRRRLAPGGADEAAFWQAASPPALDPVWDNDEDDVYAGLLET